MRVPILYCDDDLVVIDKPAGLPLHPLVDGDPYPASALQVARAQLGLGYLGTPQRLALGASGAVVCVTRRDLIKELAAALAAPRGEQVFLALAYAVPRQATGKVDAPLVREGDRWGVAAGRDKRAIPAATHYRVLGASPDGRYSLLEVVPERGPGAEQIAAHLAYLGVPLVGDVADGPQDGGSHGAGAGGPARATTIDIRDQSSGSAVRPRTGKERGRRPGSRELAKLAIGKGGAGRQPGMGVAQEAGAEPPSQVGGGWPDRGRRPAPRPGLHLLRVAMRHPVTGQAVTCEAPAPELFARAAAGLPELELAATMRHVRRIRGGLPGLAELVELAAARRAVLAADPGTTIYRLANGAADGLPGLTADRYGDALVVNMYDEAARPEPPAPALLSALGAAAGASAVYVKHRQREASRVDEEELPALAPGRPAAGPALGEYPALEDGLRYLVRPGEGWNPGLFPDMREMRGRVRAWAEGARVLNCFAYTCGFGVAAAAGRASRVVNLDVSAPALERGAANYRLNGLVPAEGDFLYGDAFDWLERLARRRELFDLVILDPPGFARTKQHVWSAAQNYGKLAQLAAAVTAAGGLLIACCNVADLSWRSFEARVTAGLDEAWRARDVIGRYGAPSIDFPVEPGRESYLKILAARLA